MPTAARRHQRHHLPQSRLRLALAGVAFHQPFTAAPALEAGPRGGRYDRAGCVEFVVDVAALDFNLTLAALASVVVAGRVGRGDQFLSGDGAGEERIELGLFQRDVLGGRTDGTLVARAAEATDALLDTAGDGRRARLLQADDVTAEAETEVAVVLARDLLRRNVDLAIEQTGAGADQRIGIDLFVRIRYFGRGG